MSFRIIYTDSNKNVERVVCGMQMLTLTLNYGRTYTVKFQLTRAYKTQSLKRETPTYFRSCTCEFSLIKLVGKLCSQFVGLGRPVSLFRPTKELEAFQLSTLPIQPSVRRPT